ncbi:FAD-binding oxidoreductase [Aspergillus thermomutatus]|uniref:Delta(24)-sterol reductase n=1 Tax=Aspergillus thermomutatus TaxID=41047 RepID=A0A397HWY9_ASPTH|nr:uncharacterized protein CDV56_109259 [Aspergillus thermomutatus]RHZ66518.1 hypothetical protein CDV56_109259 [Aspergillus thermomutatus]
MDSHHAIVQEISFQVKRFYADKKPFYIYHGSTNSTRASKKSRSNTVDTSRLNRVLCIDRVRKVALVEPNVPMDMLVQATLPQGLIPPVVMDFPGITVGGGFAGTSGESSSYRHGFFDRTVNWIEIVIGNGEVLKASATEHPDLFFGAACSFGTLGITTLVELQLLGLPAEPVVELTYVPISKGVNEAVRIIEELTPDAAYQYIDGIMFSKDRGVICAGAIKSRAATAAVRMQTFAHPTDPWFYMHVEQLLSSSTSGTGPVKELVPLVDYLFRYDRGGFWVGKYGFQYFLFPQTEFMRWLLDDVIRTRVMYHAVHKSGLFREYTIQDVAVPYAAAEQLIDYLDDSFGKYPLWLCPVRQTTAHVRGLIARRRTGFEAEHAPDMMLSVGVWGPGPKGKTQFLDFNRRLEKLVRALGGEKWLYARTWYTDSEFWSIYDRSQMDELRERYHAGYLPNLYHKVCAERGETAIAKQGWVPWLMEKVFQQWPICGVYGLIHTFWNKEYLLDDSKK